MMLVSQPSLPSWRFPDFRQLPAQDDLVRIVA